MRHLAIDRVLKRAELSKSDSDFAYFFDLLLVAEALFKTVSLGMVAAIADDTERNRYRLEHALVRADGLGDWARVTEDALTGAAAHYLLAEAYPEQTALTKLSKEGDWQYSAVSSLKECLAHLQIPAEELPVKSDMKRWFRLLGTLRNKTKGHGATRSKDIAGAAKHLERSIDSFYLNFSLFDRPWVYLHRNLSGKYRVSPIAGDVSVFEHLKKESGFALRDGVQIYWGSPRHVPLLLSDPDLEDFFYANGAFSSKRYELLSYHSGNKKEGAAQDYRTPPGTLPVSETEGPGELMARTNCLSNAPKPLEDYVRRMELEAELFQLLVDDKRPIVTLRGRGGIGKTSLALEVLEKVYETQRYTTIAWLSSRDVDLQLSGPKAVRPRVVSPEDMGDLYARLVLSNATVCAEGFNAKVFLEQQLQMSESGPVLFIFDNFETTQNPLEMFTWIDTYIRLPNKVLITTRLRDFKGDYPVDVSGMRDTEARILIERTASHLGVREKVTGTYIDDLIRQSEGHPYVIKILLGEVAKTGRAGSIPHLIAGSGEVLTALFERTYAALSPCAQRAFLTLSSWNSSVPRLALEAVLLRSTGERQEVETGIELLLQYSLAESHMAPADNQEFLALPLIATVFGKRKLNISPSRTAIQSDVELLRLLGPSRRDDIHLSMATRLERFVAEIAKKIDAGERFDDYESVLEMICRSYPQGWLLLARWHIERGTRESYERAKSEIQRFLEDNPSGTGASEAWRQLAGVCYRTGDSLGEIHAFIERSQIDEVPFYDISSTANRLNQMLRTLDLGVGKEERRALAQKLLGVLESRKSEADATDFSRMAWLAIQIGEEARAQQFVKEGLDLDQWNDHCQNLATRLGIQDVTRDGIVECD